jgi:UDP-N-acetylmuramoyl-tripeptide--D-alanyl-D-alanine ligase
MEKISIEKIVMITKGKIIQGDVNQEIIGIEIDSRKIKKGDLYIPIVGENNNGHDYMEHVFKNGGNVVLSEEKNVFFPKGLTVLLVESTLAAMKALADYNRHRYNLSVIAITGSSGKTTTKDIVAAVLSQKFNIIKTQGNFNNEYGIPQTLFSIEPHHEIAVIEMGMDHLGDIEKSIDLVEPNIGIITNIGLSHIEILKTQENIFKAKKEIFKTLKSKDIGLINGDDPILRRLLNEENDFQIKSFGIHESSDCKVIEYHSHSKGLSIYIDYQGKKEEYIFDYPGEHNVYNCLVGIWLGYYYKMTPNQIQKGLKAFIPSSNRMDVFSCGEITIINDSYNANPDAMKGALDVLKTIGVEHKRTIAILGDMLEMGEYGKNSHQEIGKYATKKTDVLIGVGVLGKEICNGFKTENNEVYHVDNADEAGKCIQKMMQPGDIILIKASRGIGLEKTIEYIKEEIK